MVLSNGIKTAKYTELGVIGKCIVYQVTLSTKHRPTKTSSNGRDPVYEDEDWELEEFFSEEEDEEEEEEEEMEEEEIDEYDPDREAKRKLGLPVQFNFKACTKPQRKRKPRPRRNHDVPSEDAINEEWFKYWAKHGYALAQEAWRKKYQNHFLQPEDGSGENSSFDEPNSKGRPQSQESQPSSFPSSPSSSNICHHQTSSELKNEDGAMADPPEVEIHLENSDSNQRVDVEAPGIEEDAENLNLSSAGASSKSSIEESQNKMENGEVDFDQQWQELWDKHCEDIYTYHYNLFYNARTSSHFEEYAANFLHWEGYYEDADYKDVSLSENEQEIYSRRGRQHRHIKFTDDVDSAAEDQNSDNQVCSEMSSILEPASPPQDMELERCGQDSDGPPDEVPIHGILGKCVPDPSSEEPIPSPKPARNTNKSARNTDRKNNSDVGGIKKRVSGQDVQTSDLDMVTDQSLISDKAPPDSELRNFEDSSSLQQDASSHPANNSFCKSADEIENCIEDSKMDLSDVSSTDVMSEKQTEPAGDGRGSDMLTTDSKPGQTLSQDVDKESCGEPDDMPGMDSDSTGPPDEVQIHGMSRKLVSLGDVVFRPGPQGDEEIEDPPEEVEEPALLDQPQTQNNQELSQQASGSRREPPPEILDNPELGKYWGQRHRLFSRYDQGIVLDRESWFSVTPEIIAEHIAERVVKAGDVVVDGFCGAGGNAIQFALKCKYVIAVDIDPVKLNLARQNARIYKVEHKIQFVHANFLHLGPHFKADVVFLSPPWGGPDYKETTFFNLDLMRPPIPDTMEVARQIAPNIVFYFPRNIKEEDVISFAQADEKLEIQKNFLNTYPKAITAYYGDFPYPEIQLESSPPQWRSLTSS